MRDLESLCDIADLPDIVALRVLAKAADGHVLDHPLAQPCDGATLGHGALQGSGEQSRNPRMQRLIWRNLTADNAVAPSHESGLVSLARHS